MTLLEFAKYVSMEDSIIGDFARDILSDTDYQYKGKTDEAISNYLNHISSMHGTNFAYKAFIRAYKSYNRPKK